MVDLSWFRRRQQAGLRPYDKPARERHIVSVVSSCLSVLLLILSLSLQEWGKAETARCKFTFKLTKVVIEDKTNHNHHYSFSSKSSYILASGMCFNPCLPPLSHSDGVLLQQPADPHFVCHQCLGLGHHLFPDLHSHQCWLPERKTGIPPTLLCLQHHLTYV